MPNHIHGVLVLHRRGEPCVRPIDVHPVSPGDQPSGNNDTLGDHKDRPYIGDESWTVSKSNDHNTQTGDHKDRPYVCPYGTLPGTVGRVVQAFKSITTHEYVHGVRQHGWRPFPAKLWQRNYYEHIIRDDDELNRVREYIVNNPMQWEMDRENPDGQYLGQPGKTGQPQGVAPTGMNAP